jgi:hypothetical protein
MCFRYDGGQRCHGVEKAEWQSGKRALNICLGNLRVQERDDLVGTQPAHLPKLTGGPSPPDFIASLYRWRWVMIGFLPGRWTCRVRRRRLVHGGRIFIILARWFISCHGVARSDITEQEPQCIVPAIDCRSDDRVLQTWARYTIRRD